MAQQVLPVPMQDVLRERGVRIALGASRTAVLRLVLREGMTVVSIGVGIRLGLFVDRTCVFENAVRTPSG